MASTAVDSFNWPILGYKRNQRINRGWDIVIRGGDGVGFYSLFGTSAVVAGVVEPHAETPSLPLLGGVAFSPPLR